MLRCNKGMTLIEMIVVVAIIGILASVTVGAITKWIPRNQVKAASLEIADFIREGQSQGIRENADVTYSFSSSAVSWTCAGDTENQTLDNVSIDSWSPSNPVFEPRGIFMDGSGSILDDGTIAISNQEGNCTISMEFSGLVKSSCTY